MVGNPFTASPGQPLIRSDAHRGRSPRTTPVPGRTVPRSRVQPRSARPLARFSSSTLIDTAHLWYNARNDLWLLEKEARRISTDNSSANSYIARFLDDPGPIKLNLLPSLYTTSRTTVQGSWCPQRHQAGGLARGVLRNADGSSGAPPPPLPPSAPPPPPVSTS